MCKNTQSVPRQTIACYHERMDITYGSPAREAFVTNVGLITSNGSHGHNIMAAEWTFQVSYDPGLMAISVGPKKATHDNIAQTRMFGVTIATEDQNILASMAGAYSGKDVDKIGLMQELGFGFHKAEHIDVWMPDTGMLHMECEVIDQQTQGDHVVFIGKTLSVVADPAKRPLAYHRGQYWSIGEHLRKPTQEERAAMHLVAERYRKNSM